MFINKTKIKLDKKEVLILLNLIEKIDVSNLDEAERVVLFNLESLLEKEVTETFLENYNQILEEYKKDILK